MTEDAKARYVAARLAEKRWKQADLVRETGLDKNTISDFLSGKREPSLATLAKIEDALVLTRGTLAALGEDPSAGQPAEGPAAAAAHLTDEELLADLTYRLQQLKRQNAELSQEVVELRQQNAELAARTPAQVTADWEQGEPKEPEPPDDVLAQWSADEAKAQKPEEPQASVTPITRRPAGTTREAARKRTGPRWPDPHDDNEGR